MNGNGQVKVGYSFSRATIDKLEKLCEADTRNKSNMLSWLVSQEYERRQEQVQE